MKKIAYTITKIVKNKEDFTLKGHGFIHDNDIIYTRMSKKGNPYLCIFEDAVQRCHPIPGKPGQFSGNCYELIEFDNCFRSIEYKVTYKFVD